DPGAEHDRILERHAAAQAGLRHHDAVAADDDVVADLDQVVDLGAFADHGVADAAAIDHGPGADLDVDLDDDAAYLRRRESGVSPHQKAEAILADAAAGMDDHAVADQRVDDRAAGADRRVATDLDAGTDHRGGADHGSGADPRLGPDHRA